MIVVNSIIPNIALKDKKVFIPIIKIEDNWYTYPEIKKIPSNKVLIPEKISFIDFIDDLGSMKIDKGGLRCYKSCPLVVKESYVAYVEAIIPKWTFYWKCWDTSCLVSRKLILTDKIVKKGNKVPIYYETI